MIEPLADVSVKVDTAGCLMVTVASNLTQATDGEVTAAGVTRPVKLIPETPATVSFDLALPTRESSEPLEIRIKAGGFEQRVDRALLVRTYYATVAALPEEWEGGQGHRGKAEQTFDSQSGADASTGTPCCGGVTKTGFIMHPPWKMGVGYTFVRYAPVTLPAKPAAAFQAVVGKGDGSYLGDGILFRVMVIDEQGGETQAGEQTVTNHTWLPIEADLSPWAGKTVRIKLISDVGKNDNAEGDWCRWADMRIESKDKLLGYVLKKGDAFQTEPGPLPLANLTLELLRGAKQGWLHYDGIGMEGGSGQYGTTATVNDVVLGPMTYAGGAPERGIWAEKVSVPLTPAAIATLSFHNRFKLLNASDCFKVRRFWLELELADGRKCSSDISTATFAQPPDWKYADGIRVPFGEDIEVVIRFRP